MPRKFANKAIAEMKKILYNVNEDENIPFQVIWDSFSLGDVVTMKGGVKLFRVERGENDDGKRFVTIKGIMPEGSRFPYNLHLDAWERFTAIKGVIRAVHIPIDLKQCQGITMTKGVRHAFESISGEAEFIAHIIEEKI